MNILQNYSKPVVIIFSSPSGLALSLIEQLLTNFCKVIILTNETEDWNKKIKDINEKSSIEIINLKTVAIESIIGNYIIFISSSVEQSPGISTEDEYYYLDIATQLNLKLSVPSLYLFSLLIYPEIDQELLSAAEMFVSSHKDIAGILFISELLGNHINLSENRLLTRIIKDISEGNIIRVPENDLDIYVTSTSIAAIQIIKRMFSFGGLGEKVGLMPKPVKLSSLIVLLKEANQAFSLKYQSENFNFPISESILKKEYIETDIKEALLNAISWFAPQLKSFENIRESVVEIPNISPGISFDKNTNLEVIKNIKERFKIKVPKPKVKLPRKITLGFISLIIFLFVSPYLLLLIGGAGLFLTRAQIKGAKIASARYVNNISSDLFKVSHTEFVYLEKLPVIGNIFSSGATLSRLSQSTSKLVSRGLNIVDMATHLSDKLFGVDGKQISYYSRQISLELSAIYEDLSFLESDVSGQAGTVGYFYNKLIGNLDLKAVRQEVSYANNFVKELPDILGENKKKLYLVLFQNNMELRPTGGFIGSYALISLDEGKITDVSVQDVYDADGQLSGHVDPPEAIKKYLGEAGWYLRDSNWDPDFGVSAESAEWFLDKEIDTQVDGVIGIDLEFVKRLVNILGPLKLADFDKEVNSENLYNTTETQVEEDFFPGSRKKSNFLTSLSRELLNRITHLQKSDYFKLSEATRSALDEKHVQVSLHNLSAQKGIAGLGWDGAIGIPKCDGNCYSDFLEVNEANVGVNKANYYIKRDMHLEVELSDNSIKHILTVNITNSGPFGTGANKYKSYIRTIVPNESEFLTTELIQSGKSVRITPEVNEIRGRYEAGVLVEVAAGSNASVVYRWETRKQLKYESAGEYGLLWSKQAGTLMDPITVNIQSPFLTRDHTKSYTTTLKENFNTIFNW